WRMNIGLHVLKPAAFKRGCTAAAGPAHTATTLSPTPAPAETDVVVAPSP
ncbi:MAG: hypothetical protein JOZ15_05280, partial [Acidobacteria bacterium]|nr:hypothetical protein [Acidobacteriota bacterium]